MNIDSITQTLKHNALRITAVVSLTLLCVITLLLFASRSDAEDVNKRKSVEIVPTTSTTSTTTTTTTAPPPPSTTTTTVVKRNVPPDTTPPVIEQSSGGEDVYLRLAQCESGDPTYNGSSGFDGAFQFLPSTWNSMGTGYAFAYEAPFAVQLDAAKRLIARSGWGQFPQCARKLGML